MMSNSNESLTEDDARMYIKLLDMARERIRSNHNAFICSALYGIAIKEPEYENYANSLIRNIEKILKPDDTLNAWYRRRTGKTLTCKQAEEMRLRWIDELIKSIKQKTRKSGK